jgi:hypothetical protein
MRVEVRGEGRALFVAVLLLIAGTLNVIYGIAAIADGDFFVAGNTTFVLLDLSAWGWILLLVGILQVTGGFSLMSGGVYGRVIGLAAASIGAIAALLGISGTHPFWSLGIFALCVIVIHGLLVYGEPLDRSTQSQV